MIAVGLPWAIIGQSAKTHSIDSALVAAIIVVESSGSNSAVRFEPAFYERYLSSTKLDQRHRKHARSIAESLGCTLKTELYLRAFSWGYMQVMGQVARELGFRGWLTELCSDERLAIDLGCRHLSAKFKRHQTWTQAVAAYNAGSPRLTKDGDYVNQEYVDKVFKNFELIKKLNW